MQTGSTEAFQRSLINDRSEWKEQIGIGDYGEDSLNQTPELIHQPTPIQDRQILVPEFRMLAISPVFSPNNKRQIKRTRSQMVTFGMASSGAFFLPLPIKKF